MIPALKSVNDAIERVEEMPDDADLTSALWLLGQAKARIAAFAQRQERESDTEPSPPPSVRGEQPTVPDGAE